MDDLLTKLTVRMLPPGAIGAVDRIRPGDEANLTPAEFAPLANSVIAVQRASGAARALARELLRQLGLPSVDIPRSPSGAPVWPDPIIGSLAHDPEFAIAVMAKSDRLGGIGVDIEPCSPLDDGLVELVAQASEIQQFRGEPLGGKTLFSIKEAIFKAVHPRDGIFLDFKDVIVDPKSRTAVTSYRRIVHWRLVTEPHLIAVAWW